MTAELDATATARRTLQRVILPGDHNQDVLPLYVETRTARGQDATPGKDVGQVDDDKGAPAVQETSPVPSASETWTARIMDGEPSRRSCIIYTGRRASFGTYFNAFPASYWRRWTRADGVTLRLRLAGDATVMIYRSTSKGHSWPEQSVHVDDDTPQTLEFELSLEPFMDGGWYWFDILAGDRPATLEEGDWSAVTDRLAPGRFTIGITTFNRPDYCVDQLRKLGQADDVLEILDEILIIDQGTQRVEDHPDFAEAAKGVADRLRMIDQGNLGGSGGFSRAMDETVRAGQSDYVLLLDDDVITEPEGMLRATTFADLARRPTIVGGQMFSLYDRSVLHAYGETVAKYRWFWGPAPNTKHGHDFADASLRQTPWLHRRIDVDYNGWWMCLIPTEVVRELGLALPVFIKWDDAEYGLRASAAGYPTVTMPGVAVWHMPWHEKDDTVDWQAYYHRRNRILAGLLHSPYERGGRLVTESFETQIRHLLSMQYYPAESGLQAIEDLLDGPDRLHQDLRGKLTQLREMRAGYADQQKAKDIENFPPVHRRKPPRKGKAPTSPSGRVGLLRKALLAAARQALPVDDLARQHPQATVAHQDAQWWLLSRYDSALVSAADGTGAAWHQRDRDAFRSLLQRSLAVHARLLREWPQLRERYRAAAPDFTSPERWRETFEASRSPNP